MQYSYSSIGWSQVSSLLASYTYVDESLTCGTKSPCVTSNIIGKYDRPHAGFTTATAAH